MSGGAPSKAHERRTAFLRDLATLAGFTGGIGGQLPDGARPDVIRYALGRHLIFLGDAKETETPRCPATQARLEKYLRWLRANEAAGGGAVFTICFGRRSDADGWFLTMLRLARRQGLTCLAGHVTEFEPGLIVAWLLTGHCSGELEATLRRAADRAA